MDGGAPIQYGIAGRGDHFLQVRSSPNNDTDANVLHTIYPRHFHGTVLEVDHTSNGWHKVARVTLSDRTVLCVCPGGWVVQSCDGPILQKHGSPVPSQPSDGTARSRSPRRQPDSTQPRVSAVESPVRFPTGPRAFVIRAPIQVARAAVARLPKGRRQVLLMSALNVLEVYATDTADLERLGKAMCKEVVSIGGLVRKVAQQLSQLPDVVTAVALRRELQVLQGRNKPRDKREIEQQLMRGFPGAMISVLGAYGAGCMGEVSEVLVHGDIDGLPRSTCPKCGGWVGTKCAAKTVNPKQQRLFEEDFELFARLSEVMAIPLACLRKIDQQAAAELEAVVSKITDMASNGDLVSSVRRGFDMEAEEAHTRRGAEVLRRVGRDVFFAPQMYAVSENKDALLMELVEGELLEHRTTAVAPPEFVRDFIGLYVRMLRERYLHQDLHPANIIVLPESAGLRRFALIDWGEVVEVPNVEDTDTLLRTVVAGRWMGAQDDSLRELFRRLGVVVKDTREVQEDAYQALANMLNVVQALRGDKEVNTATLIGASAFRAPGWLEAWQKATNALAISLQAAGASPDAVSDELRKVLEDVPALAPPAAI